MYHFQPQQLVNNVSAAKNFCAKISAVLPYEFNVSTMNEIANLIKDEAVSFLLDIEKTNTGAYKWTATGKEVASDLWHQGEPSGNGVVVLRKKDNRNGLYVTSQANVHFVCQLDVSSVEKKRALQQKWSDLPVEELEPLEQILLKLHLHDPLIGVKASVENAKRTKMLLRLIQQIIES